MPIKIVESMEERGPGDARRHREKQREAIKKKLPEIIAEESIITKREGRIVKVPLKGIDIPHFRPKQSDEGGYGIGQGPSQPGDIIDQRPVSGDQPGGAGQEPGVDYIETEIEIEELLEMMFEDLGLPKLEQKTVRQLAIELGFKIGGCSRNGPWPLLSRRDTAKEGIHRFWEFLNYLKKETGRDESTCYVALKQANGILRDAMNLLKDTNFQPQHVTVEPFSIVTNDDLRFWDIKESEKLESQALVIVMIDRSGSMTTEKKYISRSMAFWLVEFLRHIYQRVEIRFIVHDASAEIVDEEIAYKKGESGGTLAWSAYEKAIFLIDSQYPTKEWNVYLFHFSDGDDADPKKAVDKLKECLERGVNMFGYCQINPQSDYHLDLSSMASHTLLEIFSKTLQTDQFESGGIKMVVGVEGVPFVGMIISAKEQILTGLKYFLKKDRWSND